MPVKKTHLFTSESVSEGHPDKLCDRIANSVLDEILKQDPESRVAVEALATNGVVMVAGEITTEAYVEIQDIVRQTVTEVGYNSSQVGFDGNTCGVIVAISQQSPEIAGGVFNPLEGRTSETDEDTRDEIESQGAGDQGIIFGYANSDNDDYFPVAGKLSHLLAERLAFVRKNDSEGSLLLRPDAKTQVTIQYEDGEPVGIDKVLISTQHSPEYSLETLNSYLRENVIEPVIEDYIHNHHVGQLLTNAEDYLINPAGPWSIGGPQADAGLVGRKIIVDSYNGYARHGGGNYNGKDATKVDRSAAYALRWVAKNLVAAGAAEELELQVAYAIGSVNPVSIYVDTRGKRSVGVEKIEGIINEVFDLRPGAIIRDLDLKKPRFKETSAYGHFGRNPENLFTWERLDKVEEIQNLL